MRCGLLAILLLLASCTPQPPKTPDEIEAFSRLTDKTVALMHEVSIGASAVDVRTAIEEVLGAFEAARPQIHAALTRIGQSSRRTAGELDPVAVMVCLEARTTGAPVRVERPVRASVVRIDASDFRPHWVDAAIDCVVEAKVYLENLSDERAADDVGFALTALHSLLLAVFADLGTDEPLPPSIYRVQLESYRSANEIIMRKLAPRCREWTAYESVQVAEVHYDCVAYDGHSAQGLEVYQQRRLTSAPLDRTLISAQATRFTSRGLATAAQPKLDALIRALAARDAANRRPDAVSGLGASGGGH